MPPGPGNFPPKPTSSPGFAESAIYRHGTISHLQQHECHVAPCSKLVRRGRQGGLDLMGLQGPRQRETFAPGVLLHLSPSGVQSPHDCGGGCGHGYNNRTTLVARSTGGRQRTSIVGPFHPNLG